MKIMAADTFGKSFKRFIDGENPLKFRYWVEKYYDVKRGIKSLWTYFPITTKMVPWDYSSVLHMMRFQIGILADYMEKSGIEIEETRIPKIARMRRFIELADHKLNDDYAERCGYNYDYGFDFVPVDGKPNLTELVSNAPQEVEENNSRAIKEAHALENKEWEEMMELLKDMRSWWD